MITNKTDIPLALAVWLLHDSYDHIQDENYISATALLRPLRQIILKSRVASGSRIPDLDDFVSRALGNSVHDSIEKAWTENYRKSLALLGHPPEVIERIRVNPTDDEVRGSNSIIPIYLEQRQFREIDGFVVGGKFDMVTDGILQDTKSTSAYTWVYGGKDEDYTLQGSLYRWIDAGQPLPKIQEDYIRINYLFTDWQKSQARQDPNYPQSRLRAKEYPLLSLKDTESWVRNKLKLIRQYQNAPENEIPECTEADLWRSAPVFKYYADPNKTSGRSTKNFDTASEARKHQAEKGGKGTVIHVPGTPKRCQYCEAFSICNQRRQYYPDD